ncbi:MAG TPA: long-chain fatty acid--CoA ligase [Blastocatellia bacterium]|nr:long-chain fatty acid--CoA ligase [Blastocatellia bacterium]
MQQFGNLRQLLEARAAATPRKAWLCSAADGRRWTYAQFNRVVNQTANLLLKLGVRKGDTVSLLLSNCPEYVIAYFACWQIGAVAGPVNSHLKGEEIEYVLSNSEAVALVTERAFLHHLEESRARLPLLKNIILIDEAVEGTIHYPGAVSACPSRLRPIVQLRPVAEDDEAVIIYTSGTTGKPKGCLLTHRNLLANARQITEWLKFTADDRLMCVMPLFHMNGVMVTTVTPLYAGGSMVIAPKFSATRHWEWISEYRVTSFGSVATMLSMLLHTYPRGIPKGLETRQLRFAMCGSAAVPEAVLRQFEERFGCLVIEGYGLSESTCRSTFNPPDERRRPGSIGLPIGNEMKIFDDEGRELGTGEVGEIVLRGENILKGYFKNPEATARAFRSGWFHTGDVGYRDADGFFYIVDRKSDLIIRGGENIYPREIDEVLYRHPAVRDAAVVGVPDELYGEEVKAFVVLKDGAEASGQELIDHCREHLADYKCPKSVEFLREIPKGPTGKLLRRELAKMGKAV